jgi:CarD family transcriptional regulator
MAVKIKTPAKKQLATKAAPAKKAVEVARKAAVASGPKVIAKQTPVAVKAVSSKPVAANKAAVAKAAEVKAPAKTAAAAVPAKSATVPAKTATVAAKKPVAAAAPTTGFTKASAAVKQAAAKVQAVRAAIAASPVVARPAVAAAAQARTVPAALAKSGAAKLSAAVAPASPKVLAERATAAQQALAAQKKNVNQRHGFKTSEFIVYPAHGVGRIVGIEEQEIAGMSLELFVINFEKEKLTLRVPTGKLESVGMRKLAGDEIVRRAMDTLKGRARVKRTMWSRRAQEYVAKINSGDLISIAEVVRDLYRSEAQPEQSYSERQLYEDALDRMAREIAVVDKLDDRGAVQRITDVLSKSARGRRIAEDTAAAAADADVKAA